MILYSNWHCQGAEWRWLSKTNTHRRRLRGNYPRLITLPMRVTVTVDLILWLSTPYFFAAVSTALWPYSTNSVACFVVSVQIFISDFEASRIKNIGPHNTVHHVTCAEHCLWYEKDVYHYFARMTRYWQHCYPTSFRSHVFATYVTVFH